MKTQIPYCKQCEKFGKCECEMKTVDAPFGPPSDEEKLCLNLDEKKEEYICPVCTAHWLDEAGKFPKQCPDCESENSVVGDGPNLNAGAWKQGTVEEFLTTGEAEPENTGGIKHDTGKLRWDLLPYGAVREIVRVLTFGCSKYGDRNWEQGFSYGRVFAALQRHLTAFWEGEDLDEETGISHLAHAGCCILFLLTFVIRGKGIDDRPKQL